MTSPLSSRWLLPLLFGLVAVTGCGSSEKIVPVTGKVTLDGEPLTAGTGTFQPDESKGNKSKSSASWSLSPDGNYTLFTAEKEGRPLGWDKIGVSPVGRQMGGMGPLTTKSGKLTDPNKNLAPNGGAVNKKYHVPATSGLSIEVVDKPGAGAYDLKLTK